jgi:uncharacterized protein YqeY
VIHSIFFSNNFQMSLTEQISKDLISAMKAKEAVKLRGIRLIKSALLLLATDGKDVTPEAEMQVLQKMAKQRRDSMEIYKAQNRNDLFQIEQEELIIIESYLPRQMDATELKSALQKIIQSLGANGAGDFGKVMPAAMKELAGKSDGKSIAAVLKELLG